MERNEKMMQTKITVETTEDDYFLFLKFKEAKDASFVCFETSVEYKRGYDNINVKKSFHILSKSAFSESVNKKITVFETQIYQLEMDNRVLKREKEQLHSELNNLKRKKYFWQR